MEWLQNLLSGENGSAVQLVLITVALVVLLICLFWIFRKLTGASAPKATKNRVPRLSVTDSSRVDESRYLVLVRRDNVEHLVMIGGPTDIVIESNIERLSAPQTSKPAVHSKVPNKTDTTDVKVTADTQPASDTIASTTTSKAEPLVTTGAAAIGTAAIVATQTELLAEKPLSAEPVENFETAELEPEIDISSELNLDAMQEEIAQSVSNDVVGVAEQSDFEVNSLETDISEQLGAALSGEITTPTPDDKLDVATDGKVQDDTNPVDDMQRLLDELSGNKEPAQ